MHEQLALYARESVATHNRRGARRLPVYLGLAVLLAAASLVAVNSRGRASSRFPPVLVPRSGATCASPSDGFLFSQVVDGNTFQVCISRQGNIRQISYPDTAHTQIAFDGYCLWDSNHNLYKHYSPRSGVASSGFGPATLTQSAPEVVTMTRNTSDGKLQLTEFIKINIQPRSVFVGMTVKNLDSVSHSVAGIREVAPAIDGDATDDQYNEFGGTGDGEGKTGQAFQAAPVGANSLLFGLTESDATVATANVSDFQFQGGCAQYSFGQPGFVTGSISLFVAFRSQRFIQIGPGASVNVGKFVYRML